jgi:CRISPR-associated endonuclease/helicase Cas3
VKRFEAGELSKSEAIIKFREIDTISVIPRSVYESHKSDISVAINVLRDSGVDRDKARVIRAEARSQLVGYTVDIASYLGHSMKIESKKINDYEQILIAECGYNSEEGIIRPVLKPKAEVVDFSAHSF